MLITAARLTIVFMLLWNIPCAAQVNWVNVNSSYGPLPSGFNVYMTTDSLDQKPFRAFYVRAELRNRHLIFDTDTSKQRRLTPDSFYQKNRQPLLVVNSTFFSFSTNQNLNLVVKNGRTVSYNIHSIAGKGKDTFTYRHAFNGAIGISKKRKADIAWIYSDSASRIPWASQEVVAAFKDSFSRLEPGRIKQMRQSLDKYASLNDFKPQFKKWKMQSAVAGGPVLVQAGKVVVTNNEELKFAGKAIHDLHPRTLAGYTADGQLIIMVVEGRNPGIAAGASLLDAARLMQSVGCVEALNLDGGGSSCMLVNGKETIWPSDKGKQRAIPAVFIVRKKS
jgi:hypothetical protein